MEFNLKEGMAAQVEITVAQKDTAQAFGSGGVEVLATPMMIGLMERAALTAVDPHLPDGFATVGTHLNVKHMGATPVGMKAYAEAKLIKVEGKKLTFEITARDEEEKVGEGTHERYIIPLEKFIARAKEKGEK
ncbi:thioesterase family protein [Alkaliphilus metalliredigens QYMF]|uniref:Thioesterase family protein n=1 Tax=Alkaliphilus metalliredigens (strain QYMF) TaxID=293826 RepID=A6TLR1_ALKMQ|nr:thioesterase family protein [Alkaliphilus metalliredigens]ABR47129.1 thioesterase family protein [Alkaliphilus metalliredigens QYMF]